MKKSKRNIIIAGSFILLFAVGFTTIGNKDMELVKNLDIYYTLFRELNMFYVDETDPEELITTSINSMLSSLDPYTTYIPESDMDDFQFPDHRGIWRHWFAYSPVGGLYHHC